MFVTPSPEPLAPAAAARQLALAERDLDAARAARGEEHRAALDACATRLLPLSADVQPSRQAALLRDLAFAFHTAGDRIEAAIAPMAKAVLLFTQLDDVASLRRCRSVQCLILADCGSFADAVQAGSDALRLAIALDEPLGQAAAWVNLSVAFLFAGLAPESRACAERSFAISQPHGLDLLISSSLHTRSLCLYREHDFRGALKLSAQAAAKAHREPHFPDLLRALIEALACRINIHLNDLPAAARHIELARELLARSPSERARVPVESALGLLHVHTGRLDEGFALLQGAVSTARQQPFDNLSWAMMALVQAHELRNDTHSALAVLRDLIASSRRVSTQAAIVRAQYAHLFDQSAPASVVVESDVGSVLQSLAARSRSLRARSALLQT